MRPKTPLTTTFPLFGSFPRSRTVSIYKYSPNLIMALLVQQPGFEKHVVTSSENYFSRSEDSYKKHSNFDLMQHMQSYNSMDHLKSLASMFPHLYNTAAAAAAAAAGTAGSGLPHSHTNIGSSPTTAIPPLSSMLYPPVMNPLLNRMPGNYFNQFQPLCSSFYYMHALHV